MVIGMIDADVVLINEEHRLLAKRHLIGEDEIKQVTVSMLADSGACMMNINENIQEILQLPFVTKRTGYLADGTPIICDVVGPVRIMFGDHICISNAMVLPGSSEPLLGTIPMEEMDLVLMPKQQRLVVNPAHPDYEMVRI